MLEEIVEVLKVKEDDTLKTAAVKGIVEGALVGMMSLGILYTVGHIMSKIKEK